MRTPVSGYTGWGELNSQEFGSVNRIQRVELGHSYNDRAFAENHSMNSEKSTAETVSGDELAALRALVEGTAHTTGKGFFQNLVRHLALALGVRHAFVAEFTQVKTRVRTLAYWENGRIRENIEFDLAGTSCEDVVRGHLCHHPSATKDKFPLDRPLMEMGIESYLGVPLHDERGGVLGHLAVFDEAPMPAEPH
jgi:hypothetical protein